MAEPLLREVPLHWWGTLPFAEAVRRNAAAIERTAAGGPGELGAFEPAGPLFTLGRRAQSPEGRRQLEATLAACDLRGLPVLEVDRGGLGTLHLPGQLVVFVAIACPRVRVRPLVDELLQAARLLALDHGVAARVDADDDVGLWAPHGKLASLGLRWQRGVAGHGLAINVAIDPAEGDGLTLCGQPTTRLASLGRAQPPGSRAVAEAAAELDRLLRSIVASPA